MTIDAELSPAGKAALAETELRYRTIAGAVKHREPANRRASVSLYGWIIRNVDREGQLAGGWAPLAPSTVKRKAKAGKEKMMVMTGRLRNSFRSFYDNDVAGAGSDVPYSEFHEKGGTHLPRRILLPPREEALDIGIKVYEHYIARAVEGASP